MRHFKALVIALLLFLSAVMMPLIARTADIEEAITLPVIMYHHIHKNPERWGEYIISPQTFEDDLLYLQEHGYTTVTIQDLLDFVNGELMLPPKSVMLTFDDGQESFLYYAVPLLEKYNMSAVMAVVGSYAEMDAETVHNVSYSYMSWTQLADLSRNPYVELTNHSYNMHKLEDRCGCKIMSGEDPEEYCVRLREDLEKNESLFITHTGQKPLGFAYPFGQKCPEALEVLQQMGYRVVFTCDSKVNVISRNPESLLNIGRFNRADSVSRTQFFSKLGI